MPDHPRNPWTDIAGVEFDAARLGENLAAFVPVLEEIRKLRGLDLAGVHPAVVFDPAQGYEE